MSQEFNLSWKGVLTVSNIHEVARLLTQLLEGQEFWFESHRSDREGPVFSGQRHLIPELTHTGEAVCVYQTDDWHKSWEIEMYDQRGRWSFKTYLRYGELGHRQARFFEFTPTSVKVRWRNAQNVDFEWSATILQSSTTTPEEE